MKREKKKEEKETQARKSDVQHRPSYSWGLWNWLCAKEGDDKHIQWTHPIVTCMFVSISVVWCMIALTDAVASIYLPQECPEIKNNNRAIYASVLAIYVAILLIARVAATGSMALYEFCWACNISMVMASIGIATCRPLLVGASMISVSVDQVLWYVDVLGYLFTGKFFVGVAKYLTWSQTSWARRITSTHHLWFLPYCTFAMGRIPLLSYPLSVAYVTIIDIICRWLTPFHLPPPPAPSCKVEGKRRRSTRRSSSPSAGGEKEEEEEGIRYLNVNLVYELWKDIKFEWLQVGHDSAFIHLFRLITLWSLLNVPFTLLLIPLSYYLNNGEGG